MQKKKETDLKNAAGIDTSKRAAKSDLVNLKAEVDKLDITKLLAVPIDLSKLNHVVKTKLLYDKLVAKVSNIHTSGIVLKTKYNTDKSDLER